MDKYFQFCLWFFTFLKRSLTDIFPISFMNFSFFGTIVHWWKWVSGSTIDSLFNHWFIIYDIPRNITLFFKNSLWQVEILVRAGLFYSAWADAFPADSGLPVPKGGHGPKNIRAGIGQERNFCLKCDKIKQSEIKPSDSESSARNIIKSCFYFG